MNHHTTRAAPVLLTICALVAAPSFALARQTPAETAQASDLNAEFEALVERLGTARAAFEAELDKLYESFDQEKATADEKAAFDKQQRELMAKDPAPAFVKDFAALAERAKGTETAVKALLKVVELDRSRPGDSPGSKALATLLASHIQSPELAKLPTAMAMSRSLNSEQRKNAFKKLVSDCPLVEVKANAMHSLGSLMLDEGDGAPNAEVRQLFVDLKQRFGTLTSPRGKTYATVADGVLFEFDHLQLGMQVPDFEAVDAAGVKFKLSDYKGKVVVVDFWGNW